MARWSPRPPGCAVERPHPQAAQGQQLVGQHLQGRRKVEVGGGGEWSSFPYVLHPLRSAHSPTSAHSMQSVYAPLLTAAASAFCA